MLTELFSVEDFNSVNAKLDEKFLLLFVKRETDKSHQVYEIFKEFSKSNEEVDLYFVDVEKTKDIHSVVNVTSVPTVVLIEKGKVLKKVEGVNSINTYEALLFSSGIVSSGENGESVKNVILYTTPTCPHCTTIKSYLRKNRVYFREVDVAADQKAAQDLMNRSGQAGVPQTEINGQIVVGADIVKLNQLLGINAN